MKKILFAALAALVITSCTQNEEIEAPAQKTPISFKTVVGKSTRATPMVTADFNNFKVYAYNTGATDMSGVSNISNKIFMNGVKVEKKGTPTPSWTIDGTYYWPATDKIQFFAYSPEAANITVAWDATAQYPSFGYTIKAAESQEDLLIAQATDMTKATVPDDGVALTFQHILTQINFSAKGETDGYKYTISSIKIGNVYQTNTYTFAGAVTPTGDWGNTPSSLLSTEADFYSYEYDESKKEISGITEKSLAKTGGALLLLPQTLPTDAAIIVNYSVADSNNNEIFNGNGEVALTGTWEKGKSINYILKLSNNGKELKFNPDVTDNWGNGGDVTEHPTPEATV